MRRVTCTLCLHDGDALIDRLIGQIQFELTAARRESHYPSQRT